MVTALWSGAAMAETRVMPLDDSSSRSTHEVYDYLQSQWGVSGQMDVTWQDAIDQYQRVINDTGYAPAITGYDFMNYGL